MKCEKCGKEIKNLLVDIFNYDGTDSEYEIPYQEQDEDAVVIDLTKSWTGYELSEEEMMETIVCPHCKKFPFKHKEVQVYDVVRVVMFKTDIEEMVGEIE